MTTTQAPSQTRRLLDRLWPHRRLSHTSQPGAPTRALWRNLLAARGLSADTVAHFDLAPRGDGWTYPVAPGLDSRRWKAFDSTARPKYLWLPGKPAGVTFYDPDGALHDRIAAAGSTLWLASGEADVWALWDGGIGNATCMFDGEAKNVPAWFLPELAQHGVRTLHIAPDRDRSGMLFAVKLCQALRDRPIRLFIHALPFPPGSKADVGRLLLAVGRARLPVVLARLPDLTLPDDILRPAPRPVPARPVEYGDLYERWCVEIVQAAARRAWAISDPDPKSFSRNFRCPFHDDANPSAGWNYHTHGIHCFACGSHDTHEVADRLGVETWLAFKARHDTT